LDQVVLEEGTKTEKELDWVTVEETGQIVPEEETEMELDQVALEEEIRPERELDRVAVEETGQVVLEEETKTERESG
jgi:hypothetical protein